MHHELVRAVRATSWVAQHDARLLALPFDKLVVGHGTPLAEAGRDALARAYEWLR